MSPQDDSSPLPPPATPVDPPLVPQIPQVTEVAQATATHPPDHAAQQPQQPGAPYRVPAQAEVTWPPTSAPQRRPWPVIGPALSVFAAPLWAFVVAGQLTTSWVTGAPLGQGTAVILVLVATVSAWIAGVRRSGVALPPQRTVHLVGRAVGIAALASLAFVVTLFTVTVAGNLSSKNHDVLIAFVLVAVAGAAALGGPRLTSATRPERTRAWRIAWIAMWIGGALVTLVAGADLVGNG